MKLIRLPEGSINPEMLMRWSIFNSHVRAHMERPYEARLDRLTKARYFYKKKPYEGFRYNSTSY